MLDDAFEGCVAGSPQHFEEGALGFDDCGVGVDEVEHLAAELFAGGCMIGGVTLRDLPGQAFNTGIEPDAKGAVFGLDGGLETIGEVVHRFHREDNCFCSIAFLSAISRFLVSLAKARVRRGVMIQESQDGFARSK